MARRRVRVNMQLVLSDQCETFALDGAYGIVVPVRIEDVVQYFCLFAGGPIMPGEVLVLEPNQALHHCLWCTFQTSGRQMVWTKHNGHDWLTEVMPLCPDCAHIWAAGGRNNSDTMRRLVEQHLRKQAGLLPSQRIIRNRHSTMSAILSRALYDMGQHWQVVAEVRRARLDLRQKLISGHLKQLLALMPEVQRQAWEEAREALIHPAAPAVVASTPKDQVFVVDQIDALLAEVREGA